MKGYKSKETNHEMKFRPSYFLNLHEVLPTPTKTWRFLAIELELSFHVVQLFVSLARK